MEQLGRYEILQELGRGAMGVVYKARDPNIDRVVAIKVISPEAGMDADKAKEMRERFQREAKAAGRLQHPNIVAIYDCSEFEGRAYLVMEFVEGKPLDTLIHAGQLFSLQDVASIGDQVAQGLDYAHQKGIVHRDIKPANIMMTSSGVAKVADFGIARITETSITRTGLAVGTPSYMSPEQVAGQKVDGRSDQFSLAVMLYELLTGEKAFPGDSLTTVLYRIMQEDPIPLKRVNPGLPEAVDAILKKAMSKSPADRYPRVADFGRDILAVASGGAVTVSAGAVDVDATSTDGLDTSALAGAKTQMRMAAGTGDATQAIEAAPAKRRVAAAPPKKSMVPMVAGASAAALVLATGLGWYFVIRPSQEAKRVQEEQARVEQQKQEQARVEQQKRQQATPTPAKLPKLKELTLAKEVRGGRPVGKPVPSDPKVALFAQGIDLTEDRPIQVKWFDPDGKEFPSSGLPKLSLDGKGGWIASAEFAIAAGAKPGQWSVEFRLGDDIKQGLSFGVKPAGEAPVEVATKTTTTTPPATGAVRPGTVQKRGKDQSDMVFIPPGSFTMGDTHGDGDPAEKPTGKVTLSGFWIDRYDVTFDQFAKFVQTGHKAQGNWEQNRSRGGNHPVVNVTWNDALAYCRWAEKRLPTEAEWEYAARGTDSLKYPWGNSWDANKARFRGNRSGGTTAAVGTYQNASPFGVIDMAGNVWQWTASLEKAYPYVPTDGRENLQAGGSRVRRGGSFFADPDLLRTSVRDSLSPTKQDDKMGFRCAQNG